jgi:hypothetical protein
VEQVEVLLQVQEEVEILLLLVRLKEIMVERKVVRQIIRHLVVVEVELVLLELMVVQD